MINSQHKSIFGITIETGVGCVCRGGGGDQRFVSQFLNNLQALAVYSLRLSSGQDKLGGGGGENMNK